MMMMMVVVIDICCVLVVCMCEQEVTEDDVKDKFSDYGTVKDIRMDVDRSSGYVLGYALVEYGEKSEAEEAISSLSGTMFMGNTIYVNWAFVVGDEPSFSVSGRSARNRRRISGKSRESRRPSSHSPDRRR